MKAYHLAPLLSLLACGVAPPVHTPGVKVFDGPSSITEGETVIDVDADTAYAAATDYPKWTKMFPDIQAVQVTAHQGDDARVTLVHAAGNRDNIHFHNRPATRMVWFEDTGGTAEVWAEIAFTPGTNPGTTRVHSRLFADVHGVASLFVTGNRLRAMREQKIHDDLMALRTYFARDVAAR